MQKRGGRKKRKAFVDAQVADKEQGTLRSGCDGCGEEEERRLSWAGRQRGKKTEAVGKKAWECSGRQKSEVDSSLVRAGEGQGQRRGRWSCPGQVRAGPGPGWVWAGGQLGGEGGKQLCRWLDLLASLPLLPLALHRPSGCLSYSLGPIQAATPLFPQADPGPQAHGPLLWGQVLVVPGKAACRDGDWCWSWSKNQ